MGFVIPTVDCVNCVEFSACKGLGITFYTSTTPVAVNASPFVAIRTGS